MIDFEYKIVKTNRRTLSIQINRENEVIVRAPRRISNAEIERIVVSKEAWITKHLKKMENDLRRESSEKPYKLSDEEIAKLVAEAKRVIPERVAFYAPLVGVSYGRVTIRHQKTRWGSCSAKGNLNFNCLLMLTPPEVLDSVVVHELCHRKEMNHSKRFYAEVYRVFPEYDKWDKWLKKNGKSIITM